MVHARSIHGAGWLSRLLALAQFLVTLIAGAVAVWLVLSLPLWWADAPRLPLPLSVAIDPAADLVAVEPTTLPLDQAEIIDWRGDLEVRFGNPWHQWLYIFFMLQEIVLVGFILRCLRRFVASAAAGDVLAPGNARLLRWAGGLMILEALYAPGASALLSRWVIAGVQAQGARLVVDWSSEIGQGSFIAGWLVLIISEALRRGAELAEEQSLTV